MISYHSTRGGDSNKNFQDVVETGLASDGGLFVPNSLPYYNRDRQEALRGLSYYQLAHRIMLPFVGDTITPDALEAIAEEVYGDAFRHPSIVPLKELSDDLFLMELFHGPTLAFKDLALQFLARLFDVFAARSGKPLTILGATSGDTGSAAIEACRGRDNIRIIMLHPHGRVSEVQRRQMTTVLDDNVTNIAVEGSFDDCQSMVKAAFQDEGVREKVTLTAVNSINWARVLAQVVYYVRASLMLGREGRPVHFSVPTGNFGDIYAGYLAREMGFPVGELVIATNSNDILVRTLQTGIYDRSEALKTLSPSMDISVASNFERYLLSAFNADTGEIHQAFESLKATGRIELPAAVHDQMKLTFQGASLSDQETIDVIRKWYAATGEVLDPHTAIGVGAFDKLDVPIVGPRVALATAHPAKFGASVKEALGFEAELPGPLQGIMTAEERFLTAQPGLESIRDHIYGSA